MELTLHGLPRLNNGEKLGRALESYEEGPELFFWSMILHKHLETDPVLAATNYFFCNSIKLIGQKNPKDTGYKMLLRDQIS